MHSIHALYYCVKYAYDVIIVVVHVFFLTLRIYHIMHDMYTYMYTYTKHWYMYKLKYMIVCASVKI